ncbi:hypothetical protein EVAR_30973_1 [Eumeta japonica]|uniref:Uncharacterized protein n=1 Tax=Eumeta variegata TaxID=151549 RepID=A0A4C1W792_EUMVA|nr:hypothetical protein EVAR_30973_1 [Eumeta japonica]
MADASIQFSSSSPHILGARLNSEPKKKLKKPTIAPVQRQYGDMGHSPVDLHVNRQRDDFDTLNSLNQKCTELQDEVLSQNAN